VLVPLVNNGDDGVFAVITHSRTVQNRGSSPLFSASW
jgi:hypothetical protein